MLFICSSVYGHLTCFSPLATVNNAAVNTLAGIQVSIWVSVFNSFGYISRNYRSSRNSSFSSPDFQVTGVLLVEPWLWAGTFIGITSSEPLATFCYVYVYALPPFSRWGNWGLGRFCNLPQITYPLKSGARVWTPESLLLTTTGSLPPKSDVVVVVGRGDGRQLGETPFLRVLFTHWLSRLSTDLWLVVSGLKFIWRFNTVLRETSPFDYFI